MLTSEDGWESSEEGGENGVDEIREVLEKPVMRGKEVGFSMHDGKGGGSLD